MTQTATPPLDPRTAYPRPEFPEDGGQTPPGLASDMDPTPDHGEQTYIGRGRLTGRAAIVTGADSGIGRAVAIAFAKEGADVVLSYLPGEQSDADEVVEVIEGTGRRAVAVPGDLREEQANAALVRRAMDEFGRLDIVVANAGKQQYVEDVLDLTTEQLRETYETNVFALVWLTKAAVTHLPPGGSIIASTSVQAYQPSPGLVDYAGTKAAINATVKALAGQLADKGIRVNAVAPGPVWTPLQSSGGQPAEKLPTFGEQSPLGRPGQPVELAGSFVYLASDDASFTTGSTVSVTGGMPTP